jgi:hypothetical protein
VQVNYATDYQMQPQTGTLKQGDLKIGNAVAHLTGTFNNSGETPSVVMKLNGENMPASDLEAVLPAVGVTLPAGAYLSKEAFILRTQERPIASASTRPAP